MFSQINTIRCNLIYTIVKSKNCECSVDQRSNYLEIGPLYVDRTGDYCVVQQKIHLSSCTNYTANLNSALILLMS